MTKRLGRTNRVEFRLPPDLDAAVRAECARRGWNITEWGERACRALLSELAAVSSEATGRGINEQSGPTPIPSVAGSDGVRPAVPSQALAPVALETAPSGQGPGTPAAVSTPCGSGSVEETAPTEHSAQSRTPTNIMASSPKTRPAYSRADIGPKPLSATKPRPKAATRKTKP